MPRKPSRVITSLPTDLPDRRTALADLRIALCFYHGVDIDDIHPASGYSLSLDAYLSVRASWERAYKDTPDCEWLHRHSADARADWEHDRPQYLIDYPWPGDPQATT